MLISDGYENFKRLPVGDDPQKMLHRFKVGETIPLQAKKIWIVYRGFVLVTALQTSGDETILGLLGPFMPLSSDLSHLETYQATTLTKVELLQLSMQEIESSPELLREFNVQMARCLRQTEALLAVAGKGRILDRLHGFLHLLAHEFGQQTPEGVRIDVRLTHWQIANAIGSTRVTATRFLKELREQGIFHVGKDRHMYLQSGSESRLFPPLPN